MITKKPRIASCLVNNVIHTSYVYNIISSHALIKCLQNTQREYYCPVVGFNIFFSSVLNGFLYSSQSLGPIFSGLWLLFSPTGKQITHKCIWASLCVPSRGKEYLFHQHTRIWKGENSLKNKRTGLTELAAKPQKCRFTFFFQTSSKSKRLNQIRL